MRGVFITFEGPEGSGKSTQAATVAERLRAGGREVVEVREPGGTEVGEAIRGILQHDDAGEAPCAEAEMLLFEASRAQLVRQVIRPALDRGACVICDRFCDSTTAYQGYARGFDIDQVLSINSFAAHKAVPHLTLLLDIDVDRGFERLEDRNARNRVGKDRIERESRQFHEAVRNGYLELARSWPERIKIVDTDRDQAEVAVDIWEQVDALLSAQPAENG